MSSTATREREGGTQPAWLSEPSNQGGGGWLSLVYAGTIFSSAFLLFQVQPVISKFILPWFGGSPAVWTTCMLFFQIVLFCGYAYAHWTSRRNRPRMQAVLHIVLLAMAVGLLPITPDAGWKPATATDPTWRILGLLLASVGLPYFVLSSTGPLVQSWFSRTYPGRSPYRLYALSNAGSLLALLSYPFVVEPAWTVGLQMRVWSYGFVAFAATCSVAALEMWRRTADAVRAPDEPDAQCATAPAPGAIARLQWAFLAAFASLSLLATTNHVCQDVAVIPFLWVVPLSLYLLTFIICFDHERWYHRGFFAWGTAILTCAIPLVKYTGLQLGFGQELGLHFAALFCLCMLCHGELVARKPHPRYLTSFYLMISAGGAAGGIVVSLIAPAMFSTFYEWRLALAGGFVLGIVMGFTDLHRRGWTNLKGIELAALCGTVFLLVPFVYAPRGADQVAATRNFYGVVSVRDFSDPDPALSHRGMVHGRIVHGAQFVTPERRRWPATYYGEKSGIGRTLSHLAPRAGLHVGVIGLGIGSLAAYAEPGHRYTFYEINPDVVRLAHSHFSMLAECRGEVEILIGDARLTLDRQVPQKFDVLVLDAFSGDAIPTHLLTKEAFDIYLRQIAPEGVIAIHISNLYMDLGPVVCGLAQPRGLRVLRITSPAIPEKGNRPADWMLVTRNGEFLDAIRRAEPLAVEPQLEPLFWTDDYSDLFQILK